MKIYWISHALLSNSITVITPWPIYLFFSIQRHNIQEKMSRSTVSSKRGTMSWLTRAATPTSSLYTNQGLRQHGCSGCIWATGILHQSIWRFVLKMAPGYSERDYFCAKNGIHSLILRLKGHPFTRGKKNSAPVPLRPWPAPASHPNHLMKSLNLWKFRIVKITFFQKRYQQGESKNIRFGM